MRGVRVVWGEAKCLKLGLVGSFGGCWGLGPEEGLGSKALENFRAVEVAGWLLEHWAILTLIPEPETRNLPPPPPQKAKQIEPPSLSTPPLSSQHFSH